MTSVHQQTMPLNAPHFVFLPIYCWWFRNPAANHLRLVPVYAFIPFFTGFYTSQVVIAGFLNHQLSSMFGIFIQLNIHGSVMGHSELQVPSLSALVRSSLTHGLVHRIPRAHDQELRPFWSGLLNRWCPLIRPYFWGGGYVWGLVGWLAMTWWFSGEWLLDLGRSTW